MYKYRLSLLFLLLVLLMVNIDSSLSKSIENESHQWSTLLSPHDYSPTMKWRLLRNRAIDLGWETQDHKKDIQSISISNSTEYIVSCSDDGYAKFHRVLMYPNLYPDWSHLYYGELKLRDNVRHHQCQLTPDQKQLITLSTDSQYTYIDIYNHEEIDKTKYRIDNRLPLTSLNNNNTDINHRLSNITRFTIVFPQDDYNEIWWNNSISITNKNNNNNNNSFKSIKYNNNDNDNDKDNSKKIIKKLLISPDGNILMVVLDSSKLLIQYKDGREMDTIKLDFELLDIVFLAVDKQHSDYNQQFMIVPKYTTHNTSSDKPFVVLYSLSDATEQWETKNIITPSLFPFLKINTHSSKPCQASTSSSTSSSFTTTTSPTIISFMDVENTVHITRLERNRLKLVRSFPSSSGSGGGSGVNSSSSSSNAIMRFSKDAHYLVVKYPSTNELVIYRNHANDYALHSVIDLESLETSEFQLFNLRYYYLVVGTTGGHLNYFRETVPTVVTACDGLARQLSFYLEPPPATYQPTVEHDGIFNASAIQTTRLLLIIVAVLHIGIVQSSVKSIESFIISKLSIFRILFSPVVFYIGVLAIAGLSAYEIIFQSTFTNDWPAHIHHIEQWLNTPKTQPLWTPNFDSGPPAPSDSLTSSSFDFDYSHFMHYHGPCTYPAGFLYLYGILYYLTGRGSLQAFQIIWALMEICNFITIKKICDRLKLPIILAILPIISNRLHLYNVRVVINDFPSTFILHLSILLLLNKQYKRFSVLFSFLVSLKLNYIFYSPAILFIFANTLPFSSILTNLFIMGALQIIIGIPFLLTNPIAYITIAYDISRTLLWEKTRNFKFVGRVIYDSSYFNITLLLLLITTIIIFLIRMWITLDNLKSDHKSSTSAKTANSTTSIINSNIANENIKLYRDRAMLFVFLFVNFLAITFARGLYTPFLCWYFYTYPIVLYFAGYPYSFIIAFFVAHEYLFRFFKDLLFEMNATYIYFLLNIFTVFNVLIAGRVNLKTHTSNNNNNNSNTINLQKEKKNN
ncbi:hypothetical protein PPL_08762 [Heterostelium album PN500]|uniref:Uncharacterized protein n=1 Tax=Heterostelium pallidum (strain ATCC 26659 / Pp 5 / PN500) TaxID=670386 RepID=D3BJN4_HETP5|nr:hypothetical protein PPL_08762 [Heterostelium album PN500]EFA78114.1 hypothetical protein PPL_08762 [Heterostelium album PN500]|eukprot:XP_020430240.1 hypothetical protein PPL_08762 [Heterostelium album PN500]